MTHQPDFHVLDRAECEALLLSQQVGRLAFSFRDRVDIEPIHYVYADGYIYGRTQFGSKVTVLAHHPWIAFEVDDVRALYEYVEKSRAALGAESHIQNEVDTVLNVLASMLYKLNRLY
jgi:nitroimidazol reductase NimA-like FMN-containing flavoprotein (pyridoxamine 5'-phosphate oxidase superfamily)